MQLFSTQDIITQDIIIIIIKADFYYVYTFNIPGNNHVNVEIPNIAKNYGCFFYSFRSNNIMTHKKSNTWIHKNYWKTFLQLSEQNHLPLGLQLKEARRKWNHSIVQLELLHAIIRPFSPLPHQQ